MPPRISSSTRRAFPELSRFVFTPYAASAAKARKHAAFAGRLSFPAVSAVFRARTVLRRPGARQRGLPVPSSSLARHPVEVHGQERRDRLFVPPHRLAGAGGDLAARLAGCVGRPLRLGKSGVARAGALAPRLARRQPRVDFVVRPPQPELRVARGDDFARGTSAAIARKCARQSSHGKKCSIQPSSSRTTPRRLRDPRARRQSVQKRPEPARVSARALDAARARAPRVRANERVVPGLGSRSRVRFSLPGLARRNRRRRFRKKRVEPVAADARFGQLRADARHVPVLRGPQLVERVDDGARAIHADPQGVRGGEQIHEPENAGLVSGRSKAGEVIRQTRAPSRRRRRASRRAEALALLSQRLPPFPLGRPPPPPSPSLSVARASAVCASGVQRVRPARFLPDGVQHVPRGARGGLGERARRFPSPSQP